MGVMILAVMNGIQVLFVKNMEASSFSDHSGVSSERCISEHFYDTKKKEHSRIQSSAWLLFYCLLY